MLSRRAFLAALGASALLAACGQTAAPSSPSGSTSGAADWQKQWDSWVAGAKKEGKLVLASGPSPEARTKIPEAFRKQFGIDVEYLGGPTSDLANRLRSEQAANQFTVDVSLSGSDSSYLVLFGEHLTEPIRPHLIHPEVLDPNAWTVGKVWFMDPEEKFIVRASSYLNQPVVINTEFVKPDEIKAWKDLLKPEYKGKMATYDPVKAGSGSQTSAYLYNTLGADFVKALYVDQNTAITGDYRQLSDWLARGTYPIVIAGRNEDNERLKKDGFKLHEYTSFPDASGYISAGFGLLNLFKNPPHPNAAKLFLNWILMKDGQIAWNSTQKTVSIRKDVDNSWADPQIVPKPGVNYFDVYSWEYVTAGWSKANGGVKAILGSRAG